MAQPQGHGHMLMIIHPVGDDAPPAYPSSGGNSGGGSDQGAPPDHGEPDADDSGKIAPERAGFRGEGETCDTCENWLPPDGCKGVAAVTSAKSSCWSNYKPKGGGGVSGPGGMPMMPMIIAGGGGQGPTQ
jgi:hypothetical protein